MKERARKKGGGGMKKIMGKERRGEKPRERRGRQEKRARERRERNVCVCVEGGHAKDTADPPASSKFLARS